MSIYLTLASCLLWHSLLCVESQQRQIQQQSQPVAIDQEQEREEGVHGSLRDNVGVETVAEIDRVDVVTAVVSASSLPSM
jgi:hypothetical protein